MGFGTLFFGYFLLLNNVSYFGFTDPFAAAVMLLGLYKLSTVNRYFRYSLFTTAAFALFSLGELTVESLGLFSPSSFITDAAPYISMGRCVLIAVLTVTMLEGIRQVATEVDIPSLAKRCKRMIPVTLAAYTLAVIMDTAPIVSNMGQYLFAILTIAVLIGIPVVVIINLYSIFTAYAQICMPDEPKEKSKTSKFGFVNEYRERKAQRDKEYIEYKLQKAKQRKKGGKK